MAIPILLYAESREHLVKANKRSRIETVLRTPSNYWRKARFLEKQDYLAMSTGIIHLNHIVKKQLLSCIFRRKIAINNHKIVLIKEINYKDYEGLLENGLDVHLPWSCICKNH